MADRYSCPRCGTANPAGSAFCGTCGLSLVAPGPQAPLPGQPGWEPPLGAAYPTPRGRQAGRTCWNCGLINPVGRTFCQRCGQRLESDLGVVAGGTARVRSATDGGNDWRPVWLVAVVVIAVVAVGVAVFGGVLGNGNGRVAEADATATPTPTPPPTRARTQAPGATVASADDPDATLEPQDDPYATDGGGPVPGRTPRPTRTPRLTPSPDGARTPPPPGKYVCDGGTSSVTDPFSKGWRLQAWHWGSMGKYDEVHLTLERAGAGDGASATVSVSTMDPAIVAAELGLPAPARDADVALVVTLDPSVRLVAPVDSRLGLDALRSVAIDTASDGRLTAVLGVAGRGCYALLAPAWTDEPPARTASLDLYVDLRH